MLINPHNLWYTGVPEVMASVPFAVVALILDEEGSVLSITRRGTEDDWGLIGGKVEESDASPAAALVREVQEETGIVVDAGDLDHIYTRMVGSSDKVCFCYFVKKYQGWPAAQEDGFKVRWKSWSDLLRETNTFVAYNRALYESIQYAPLVQKQSFRL